MKTLRLSGYVGYEITAEQVAAQLRDANGEEITVHLNTQGGNIYQGIEIYNLFNSYEGKKTVVMGALVASIGSYIICAFDHVVAQDLTMFMIHNASNGIWGDYRALRKEADELERMNRHLGERLSAFCGKTLDDTLALMDAETWFYGQEIMDAGFAHEVRSTGKSTGKENTLAFVRRTYSGMASRVAAYLERQTGAQGMDKETLIKEAKEMLASGAIAAKDFGIDLDGLQNELKALKEANAKAERKASLDAAFGADGLLRTYAQTLSDLGKAVDEIKADPIAKKLAQDMADPSSAVNVVEQTQRPQDGSIKVAKY